MKKFLLIMCACLMGALSGAKAWTSAAPEVGRAYYLYNPDRDAFVYASNDAIGGTDQHYGWTADLSSAMPFFVETDKYTFSFFLNGTKSFLNQNDGVGYIYPSGSEFEVWAEDGKYYLRTQKDTPLFQPTTYRYMDAKDGGYCDFTKSSSHICQWQFVPVEEAMSYMADHCASVAEANYVGEWERVTSVEMLKKTPEKFFFAIFSANVPALMVDASSDNTENTRPYYKAATNPLNGPQYLFEIENYDGGFALKSCGLNKYFGNNSESWNFQNLTEKEANCKLTITLNNGAFEIKSANADWEGRRNWGLYDYTGYVDGQKFAGNKNDAEKGSFLIYCKLKKDVDMTGFITNPSFETGDLTGWTLPKGTSVETGVFNNEGGKATTGGDGSKLFNSWWYGKPLTQEITNLPDGMYELKALIASSDANADAKIFLLGGGGHSDVITITQGTSGQFNDYSYKFNVTGGSTTIGVVGGNDDGSYNEDGHWWYKADHFRLVYLGEPATEADYTILQNAVDNAEAKTLGFEAGEYAPYVNANALKAIDEAKAIDKTKVNVRADVLNLADAMSDEMWTANTEEVSAFCGGDFTEYFTVGGQDFPYGWNLYNTGNNSRIMGGTEGSGNAGLAATSSGKALLLKFNATYGDEAGYTMPLKAGKLYKITFKQGRWNEANPRVTDVVMTDPNGASITLAPGFKAENDHCETTVGNWETYTGYFVSTTAGNYKFNLTKQGGNTQMQIAIGDIELKSSAEDLVFADDAKFAYAPGTYPAASYSRNVANTNVYGTICLPFNVESNSYIQFYTVEEVDGTNNVLKLETTDAVAAGVPAVYKNLTANATKIEVATNNATVVAAAGTQGTDPKLVGTFTGVTVDGANVDKCYYLKGNQFWQGNENFTIPAYRAYIQTDVNAEARLTIRIDGGDPTAISAIEAAEAEDGALKDGKYLINNKVVLVKNGVKYGANGQKLN